MILSPVRCIFALKNRTAVQEYDISTASMPYLTRRGQVRYKIMMGRPQEWGHHVEGEFFSGAEASRGSLMVGRSMVARWG